MTAADLIQLLFDEIKSCKKFDEIETVAAGRGPHTLIVYPFNGQPIVLTARKVK